jgi:glycerol-3-phosphate O-acyltransferase/dihydroxyacetone phosphate acyltransferase
MDSNALAYDVMIVFWRVVTGIFFREIRPRGTFNIPRDGPVIFVAGPHNNQASNALQIYQRSCTLKFGRFLSNFL